MRITSRCWQTRSWRPTARRRYFADAGLPDGATAFGRSGFAPAAPHKVARSGEGWVLQAVQPMTPAVIVERDAYLACGGQDPALPCREDTHLFLLLRLAGAACAVASRTVTVPDDGRGNRLTEQLPSSDAAYWVATAHLCEDVLRGFPALSPSWPANCSGAPRRRTGGSDAWPGAADGEARPRAAPGAARASTRR